MSTLPQALVAQFSAPPHDLTLVFADRCPVSAPLQRARVPERSQGRMHADLGLQAQRAFTLIELLIVMTIIVFLFGLLSGMMGIAQRGAHRTQTLSILHKVDTALRSFKTDFKVYPFAWSIDYQQSYPDLASGQKWSNRLNYQIGTAISDANRQHVQADMDFAGAQYGYDCSTWTPDYGGQEHPPVSIHTFRTNRGDGKSSNDYWGNPEGDPVPNGVQYNNDTASYYLNYENGLSTCLLLNRMAQERARLLILAGDVAATGVKMNDVPQPPSPFTHDGRDLSMIPLIPVSQRQSALEPGWAMDYLGGELEKRYIDGENILDAYHNPLVYIYHVLPGVRSSEARPFQNQTYIWDPQDYGLTTIGRRTLSTADAPDQAPTMTAPSGGLPDPSNLMHSDITAYAAPGYEVEFELWSAGPDHQFTYMRDDPLNRDNIPCDNYNKDLQ
jgi:prepilin-type N-terminal cleavage/methylation domain-containing protein